MNENEQTRARTGIEFLGSYEIEIQGIDHPDTAFVFIDQGTAIPVHKRTGEIVGASAEGTLGIVIYGGDPKDIDGQRFKTERAIRIPSLLQSDVLLNFHVAEIAYHEGRQAARFNAVNTLVGASGFYRLEVPNMFTRIPGSENVNPCYIGFYLSPMSRYELCLVSRSEVWPIHFGDYLRERGLEPKTLFEDIEQKSESTEPKIFSKLLFLPDRRSQNPESPDLDVRLKVLDRRTLDTERAKRDIGGWWFNVPVATYPWKTANLERSLAAYLDATEESNVDAVTLKSWNDLYSWFELIKQLALGLEALHTKGAIHGDPRPANIMTYVQPNAVVQPGSFCWIDIGLGYGAQDAVQGGIEEQTTVTPRPLGGGRSTVFYAPERDEAQEFEDADVVSLVKHDRTNEHLNAESSTERRKARERDAEKSQSSLTFFWRKQTHIEEAEVLPLKRKGKALRELGELKRGDRIQVREFLFEVDEVLENKIVVSDIYEVFLGRVLVQKQAEDIDSVRERLKYASISRYRIFKQWSQATDIFGLGMITLYMFFIRGLYILRRAEDFPLDRSKTDVSNKSSIYDRANREKIFSELAILLRNRSFLENVLSASNATKPEQPDFLDDKNLLAPGSETAKNIAELILSTDTNFELIWRGLNCSNGLLACVIYFCLRCVWRRDEVKEIVRNDAVDTPKFRVFWVAGEGRIVTASYWLCGIPSCALAWILSVAAVC